MEFRSITVAHGFPVRTTAIEFCRPATISPYTVSTVRGLLNVVEPVLMRTPGRVGLENAAAPVGIGIHLPEVDGITGAGRRSQSRSLTGSKIGRPNQVAIELPGV